MRIFIYCIFFLFICVTIIPLVESDRRNNKLSEYNERDKHETKDRYSKRNNDYHEYRPKRRNRRDDSDEDFSFNRREPRRRFVDEEDTPKTRTYSQRLAIRKSEDSDEDQDTSDVCINKRGSRCESDLSDTTNEDSDERQTKKKVIYVKKFPHEKKTKKFDKEIGTILKIHRKAGDFSRHDDDGNASEETGDPKRRRYIYEDEDE